MIAERHAQRGGLAYVLDLENGRKLFLRRLIARRAQVGLRDLLSALRQKKEGVFRTRDEVDRWQKAKAEIYESGKNLFVEHRLDKAEDLTQRLRALRHRAKDRPILVVIDSLQKLPMRMDERRAGVDWWLRTLDRLREELNLVIIAISELKRGEDGYEAREDTFKESGGVEYTAQVGLTMTRPSVEGDETPEEVTTLRVVFARDADENPKGVVACYRPLYPWYGLEECDAPGRAAPKREVTRLPRSTKTPRLFPEEGEA
jgi:replicative DNA helicase